MASDRAVASLEPGTRFGRYEVIAELASGGMATVYLGRAHGAAGFERLVALKLMHPHYARDPEFVEMFLDEARLAARIRHPNVVATLDLENDPHDGLYLVMEYIEGDMLLGLLRGSVKRSGRIPMPIVMRVILDALNGLHAAHELNDHDGEPLKIVHRDISPHNILVGIDGVARITDFGIARADQRVSTTRNGQVKGKLSYMAPEQTAANPIDRRADLFAMGVVLWECLAGQKLFVGANDGEVLRSLLMNPVRTLKSVVSDVPDVLEQVCLRALERNPDLRFATAADFADALEDAASGVGIASAKAVSAYVRDLSGSKIDTIAERTRETHTGSMSAPESRIYALGMRTSEPSIRESRAPSKPPPLPGQKRAQRARAVVTMTALAVVAVAVALIPRFFPGILPSRLSGHLEGAATHVITRTDPVHVVAPTPIPVPVATVPPPVAPTIAAREPMNPPPADPVDEAIATESASPDASTQPAVRHGRTVRTTHAPARSHPTRRSRRLFNPESI